MKTILMLLCLINAARAQGSPDYFDCALKITSIIDYRESCFELANNFEAFSTHAEALLPRKAEPNEKMFLSCVLKLYGIEKAKRVALGVMLYDSPRIKHELMTFGGGDPIIEIVRRDKSSYEKLIKYLLEIYLSNEA